MIVLILLCIFISAKLLFLLSINLNYAVKWTVNLAISTMLYCLVYFIILALNLNFNSVIITFFVLNVLLLFIKRKDLKQKTYSDFKIDLSLLIFIALLFYATFNYFNKTEQWGQWDGWAIWNLHAKFLYHDYFWQQLFTNKIAWTHPDYPLFVPSLIALFWKSIGYATPIVPILVSYLPFLGILFLMYYSPQNIYMRVFGLIVLSFDSFFCELGAAQYADTSLAFFYLLTIVLIENININKKNYAFFFLLGFAATSVIWIKNEGIMFFAITLALLSIKLKDDKKTLFSFYSGTIILGLVFIVFKLVYAPVNDLIQEQNGSIQEKLLDINRYDIIFNTLKSNIVSNYYLISIIFLYIIYLIINKKLTVSFLIISITLICYLSIYIITPKDLKWHLDSSLYRLIHQLYPAILLATIKSVENNFSSIHVQKT